MPTVELVHLAAAIGIAVLREHRSNKSLLVPFSLKNDSLTIAIDQIRSRKSGLWPKDFLELAHISIRPDEARKEPRA